MRLRITSIRAFQRAALAVAAAGLLTAAGCGDGKIARYPVSGTVMIDGKEAELALVIFCPVDPGPELKNLRPSAATNAQGVFKLTTIDSGDGAPAGKYKVIVKWPTPPPPGDTRDRPKPGPDRLKGKYYNIDTTPLEVTVEKGSNDVPPFDLKTK